MPATDVAVVDGTEIARSDLDELFGLAKATYGSRTSRRPERRSTRASSSSSWRSSSSERSSSTRQRSSASRSPTRTSRRQREDLVATRFSGNEKTLAAALKEQGLTDAVLLKTLRVSVLSKAIFDSVTKDVKVDDTEALTYYTQNQEQYKTTAPSRDVRHILIGEQVDPSCVPEPSRPRRARSTSTRARPRRTASTPSSRAVRTSRLWRRSSQTIPAARTTAASIRPSRVRACPSSTRSLSSSRRTRSRSPSGRSSATT